jgi:hypothetical protein
VLKGNGIAGVFRYQGPDLVLNRSNFDEPGSEQQRKDQNGRDDARCPADPAK